MKQRLIASAIFALFAFIAPANAQGNSVVVLPNGCGTGNPGSPSLGYLTADSTLKLCVNATVNASVGGFVPSLSYTTLTATASSSASTALPTNTGTVAFQNQTSVAVSCTLASGSATAATNEIIVPAGSTIFVGTTGYDHAACINQTGSASNVIVLAGGSGLGTGFGGGGSGGGGAITAASGSYAAGAFSAGAGVDGWDLTQGAKADSVCSTSTGTCSVVALLKYLNSQVVLPVPAGTNTIGGVFNGYNTYNTVAASQTAQALTGGSGGAAGDYLSHCMVFPTSTSPGVVTILDNSTTIFPFPGGSSSISTLVPFSIAIGAKSVSGAWKITTGANVSVTCVGKFT